MSQVAWVSIVITIFIFLLSHIIATVWWASKVNTMLDIVRGNLTDLITELKTMKTLYITKEDAHHSFEDLKSTQKVMWEKIDKIQDKIINREN